MKSFLRRSAILLAFAGATLTAIAAEKLYTIAVIPKGTTHEFWKSIHAGAVKAQRDLGEKGINDKQTDYSRFSIFY